MRGYCECGCGLLTRMGPEGPRRFVVGHNSRVAHPQWNGGRSVAPDGYVRIKVPEHPCAVNGYVFEHVIVVERALGKHLPPGAVVHHVNETKSDNRNLNLVACQDRAYHNLLHQRLRALLACGNANWLKCRFCHEYGNPAEMYVSRRSRAAVHPACSSAYQKARYVPHPAKTKLNATLAAEIRRRVADGATQRAVAAEYGVHQSTVSLLVSGKTWQTGGAFCEA